MRPPIPENLKRKETVYGVAKSEKIRHCAAGDIERLLGSTQLSAEPGKRHDCFSGKGDF